jgi:hypothetical protein
MGEHVMTCHMPGGVYNDMSYGWVTIY